LKKRGDAVKKDEDLAIIYYGNESGLQSAVDKLASAYIISDKQPEKVALIKKIID